MVQALEEKTVQKEDECLTSIPSPIAHFVQSFLSLFSLYVTVCFW